MRSRPSLPFQGTHVVQRACVAGDHRRSNFTAGEGLERLVHELADRLQAFGRTLG
jgi:hypothetical protein